MAASTMAIAQFKEKIGSAEMLDRRSGTADGAGR
jgi:hypothetical protein